MSLNLKTGIIAYGAYLPNQALPTSEVGSLGKALGVVQKTVADLDEDTTTISVDAATQLFSRLGKKFKKRVETIFIGSESHAYAVKPTGTVVAQALGLPENISLADLQFACKAGTQALQICLAYAKSGMADLSLAIGADTAQSMPGDALEYTASAGGAAFLVGREAKNLKLLAEIIETASVASDTPDFWRRAKQEYPQHGGRFTGYPAYFAHITKATKLVLKKAKLKPKDIDYCVFHTPNAKFPRRVAKQLGFNQKQLEHSLVVTEIGNTYAGSSLLAFVNVLDKAKAGDKILMTSYGSGAGADSFIFKVTPELEKQRKKWSGFLTQQIASLKSISYREYRKSMELKE